MRDNEYVTDAIPGAKLRRATDADAATYFNVDGTVTIPPDVQVIEIGGHFWLRSPRLRGWGGINAHSPVMGSNGDPVRAAHVVIREEMARQGRVIQRWTQAQAIEHARAEYAYWKEADALAQREVAGAASHLEQPQPRRVGSRA